MEKITVYVKKAEGAEDLPLPCYMTTAAAGMDLIAAVEEELVIMPGKIALVPTGIHLAIPVGYEAQVRPRSGLALTHGITLLNSPGTIDADYRGRINLILINLGEHPFTVRRGDRIAQLVFQKVTQAELQVVEMLDATERNEGGFGHTGI